MTNVSLTLAFILIAVAFSLISKFVNNLSKEIDELNFELSLLRQEYAECKHRITNIENVLDYMAYYNATKGDEK